MGDKDNPTNPQPDKKNNQPLDKHARDHISLTIKILVLVWLIAIIVIAGIITTWLRKGS